MVEAPLLVLLAVVIALVMQAALAQAFFIPSGSMEPLLTSGDRVVVSRMSYRLHDVNRGDVIVFDNPSPNLVESTDGFILLRAFGELLDLVGARKPSSNELIKRVIGLPGETVTLAEGKVFIDGFRLDEPYLRDGVRTLPLTAVTEWLVPDGHYLVFGDNRTNSSDGRAFGPISEELIVGRAVAIAWPLTRSANI